jgi:hypothetical protein
MATNNSINANSTTPLAIVNGGTAVNAVTTAPAATAWAGWDANKNLSANNMINAYTTTATAAATTTLTVASTYMQFFTGATTQTVKMPVTSTLVLGQQWMIVNNSSGVVTVQSSGSNTITTMAANTIAFVTCILTSGTTAASWYSDYEAIIAGVTSITGTANQVIASASTGAVTLSLPQSIATSSALTFGSVAFSSTSGIIGTTTNDSAAAGSVGEYITSNVAAASATSLVTNTPKNITSISLTAGDWNVHGNITFLMATTTAINDLVSWTSTTSATLPDASKLNAVAYNSAATWAAGAATGVEAPFLRVSVSGTTTVYLSAQATFGVSTLTACGTIHARRVR